MSDVGTPSSRRLLVGGERLRMKVNAPPSGGGDKYEPRTAAQARTILLPMIRAAIQTTNQLTDSLRGERLYVEARLLPNFLAPSHFPDDLLRQIGAVPVGSRADSAALKTTKKSSVAVTRRLILSVDEEGLQTLERLVDGTGINRTERQAFEEINRLDRFSVASPTEVILGRPNKEGEIAWEAVLHPGGSIQGEAEPLDAKTLEKWFKLVESLGGRCYRDYVRTVGGLTFSPVVLSSALVEQVSAFNPLRAIRPMPTIQPQPNLQLRAPAPMVIPPQSGAPRASSPLVAVFDGGTHLPSTVSTLFPTPHIDLTPETPTDIGLAHGTAVTGAVRFGLLLSGDPVSQPPCPIDSFRVFPSPPSDIEGYWMLDQIKKTLIVGKHNIVNLSLGLDLAVEDTSEPNRWTSELDQLAWENDILFVVAAGNNGHQSQVTGLHRVQVPADMVNGLSVGACDEPHDPKWSRPEYSSMGPGRHGNRVQPTGVQFGGSSEKPFPMLTVDGTFLLNAGTSFAAPLITHALADLATSLPNPTPSVLRAFAVHCATRHRTHRKLIDEVGYGRMLLDYDSILNGDPNQAHVLFCDEIDRGELLGYQLPLPSKTRGKIGLIITMSYLSPVDPTQPTEYTRAALDLTLRPHRMIHSISPPKGNTTEKAKQLDYTSVEVSKLLKQNWKVSQEPVSETLSAAPGSAEAKLRDAGKWETIRHHRVSFQLGDLLDPRIEVSYVARRAGGLDNSPTKVPFAILVSLNEDGEHGDFHDRVTTQFPTLAALPRVQPKSRVRT